MSQSTAIKTYGAIGNREDLTNLVVMVSPEKTPLWSGLEKVTAKGTYHEWQTDSLTAATTNYQIEGAEFSFTIPGYRTRTGAYTQIFSKTLEVSGTQMVVDVAGVENEFSYQMKKRMKELATDIEKALFTGTGNSGASGTARHLKGIFSWISTNSSTGSSSGTQALTESLFNDLLQTVYDAGGSPDSAYCNSFQKRKISAFATSNARYQTPGTEGKLYNFVSAYESDFGVIQVKLDQFCDTDKVAVLDSSLWRIAILRGVKSVDVAMISDGKRGALLCELTLEAGNEAGSGEIIQLTTS
jgi:hypothetical protein